jgi:hypothetical protein
MGVSSAAWRKSSLSSTSNCVEVAFVGDRVAVRDSKDRNGPVLLFTPTEWEAFLGGVRIREFDLPRPTGNDCIGSEPLASPEATA